MIRRRNLVTAIHDCRGYVLMHMYDDFQRIRYRRMVAG